VLAAILIKICVDYVKIKTMLGELCKSGINEKEQTSPRIVCASEKLTASNQVIVGSLKR